MEALAKRLLEGKKNIEKANGGQVRSMTARLRKIINKGSISGDEYKTSIVLRGLGINIMGKDGRVWSDVYAKHAKKLKVKELDEAQKIEARREFLLSK